MQKVILSDIGNVVVFFDNRFTSRRLAKHSRLDEEIIHARLFRGSNCLARDLNLGQDVNEFRLLAISRLGCLGVMTSAEFDQAYARVLRMNSPVVRLWKQLVGQGVVITAISDLDELRHQELERIGAMSLFRHAVLSYEEGRVKPSRHLIELALKRSGVAASQAVFIDDLSDNLEPAAELGVATHQYHSHKQLVSFLKMHGFSA